MDLFDNLLSVLALHSRPEPVVRADRLRAGYADRRLPGLGPVATIAMLLPATYSLPPWLR
jgi:TctA family transporter